MTKIAYRAFSTKWLYKTLHLDKSNCQVSRC